MSELFIDSLLGFLHPIQELLEDQNVSEIMINGPKEIFVERKGLIEPTDCQFEDETSLQAAVRNIAQFVGKGIGKDSPTLDARLPDGSRIHAVIPPAARNGTTVAIRKFFKSKTTLKDLVINKSISKDAARFLDVCAYLGKNIVVSGGTGSGKTTVLKVIGERIPKKYRLIVIEDSSELQITLPHCVFFETQRGDAQGAGRLNIQDLVKSAMRLRPDRIIVGEVRGEEAMDLINVMNTGHNGSMGTVHANSPKDALVRLETLAMMGDNRTPATAVRRQLASAVDILVHVKRFSDGSRKITDIAEVLNVDDTGNYQTQNLYQFQMSDMAKGGKVAGEMLPCGNLPTFMSEIENNRLPFDKSRFVKSSKDSLNESKAESIDKKSNKVA
jgi:pilus assembly protein CpaF